MGLRDGRLQSLFQIPSAEAREGYIKRQRCFLPGVRTENCKDNKDLGNKFNRLVTKHTVLLTYTYEEPQRRDGKN